MPFLLQPKNDLTEENATNDYLKWLEDEDPAIQEERQSLQVLQNTATSGGLHDRHFEPLD